MTIVVSKGPEADKGDTVFGQMFIAGEYRWLLENMQESRRTAEESKVLPVDVIEKKLGSVLLASGEDGLNAYRDTLRETAERLGMHKESGGQELLYTIYSLTFAQTNRVSGLREA